jgi:hypothetical protein
MASEWHAASRLALATGLWPAIPFEADQRRRFFDPRFAPGRLAGQVDEIPSRVDGAGRRRRAMASKGGQLAGISSRVVFYTEHERQMVDNARAAD